MAESETSYLDNFNAFRSRDNFREVFSSTMNRISSELRSSLDSVKSVLSFGPGDGRYEIEFLEKCAANVINLTAVDSDDKSIEKLKINLRNSLPRVEAVVVKVDFHSWKGLEKPVNLVLLFNVLVYYNSSSERKHLFKKIHDHWLTAGGFVAIVSASKTKVPGNGREIFERFTSPLVPWEDIEADVLDIGFVKRHAYDMQFARDFSNPDETFLRFYQFHIDHPVALNDIRVALEELFPEGKTDQCFNTLAVFQRVE